jgi:hypothetical protein
LKAFTSSTFFSSFGFGVKNVDSDANKDFTFENVVGHFNRWDAFEISSIDTSFHPISGNFVSDITSTFFPKNFCLFFRLRRSRTWVLKSIIVSYIILFKELERLKELETKIVSYKSFVVFCYLSILVNLCNQKSVQFDDERNLEKWFNERFFIRFFFLILILSFIEKNFSLFFMMIIIRIEENQI